jgi:Zn-dependent protease/predicted transcriptional regulator
MAEAVHPPITTGAGAERTPERRGERRPAGPRRAGFRLGRVAGIEIRVDWSLAIVFLLIVFNLGAGLFPALHPGWSPAMSWGVAFVAAVLFFASVLAHELAHAVVGRRRGVPVEGITLFVFGGVARLGGEPKSAGSEFVMAIVGPLASLAIGLGCSAAGVALSRGAVVDGRLSMGALGPVASVLLWLGSTNLLLAVFNLLPGFPLDGGRVLRSILWKATGDIRRATRWASGVGRFIALALIFTGVTMMLGVRVPFFGAGVGGGLWLALIGWFLNNAAVNSYRSLVISEALADVPVARLMRAQVPAVSPLLSLTDVVDVFMQGDERCLPVMEGDRFVGMVCAPDLRRVPRDRWDATPVRAIAVPAEELPAVRPDETAADALGRFGARDLDQLPVVEQGALRGVLRRADVVRWIELHSGG